MITRPATADDLGYLVTTFTKSIRVASTLVEGLENEQIGQLLMNLVASGWTATVAEQDGKLIGWVVHHGARRLAWFYVASMVRGQGVAKYLLRGVDLKAMVTSPFKVNRGPLPRFRYEFRPYLAAFSEST